MFLRLLLANTINNSRSPAKFNRSNILRDLKDVYLKQVDGIINNCISKNVIRINGDYYGAPQGLIMLILETNTKLKR